MEYNEIRKNIFIIMKKSMPDQLKRIKWSKSKILANQQKKLIDILKHAKNNSSWYKGKFRNVDIDNFSINNISELPILTKDELMDNWNDIVCDKKITKEIAEEHQRKLKDGIIQNQYYLNNYLFYSTGGSSGKRGLFVWDKQQLIDYGCQTFRYQCNDELGSTLKYKKVAVLTSPSKLHASTELFSLEHSNNMETLHCPVNLSIEELCKKLNKYQPTHLIGFSSVIRQLSICALEGRLTIKPIHISVNSEPLDTKGFDLIKKAWNTEARIQWGSVEIGIAASDNKLGKGMFLSEDYNIFETVDENHIPTIESEEINGVLVTSFCNRVLPLIRYLIDDILDVKPVDNSISNYRILNTVKGRADDYFIYNNLKIHPMIYRHRLGQEPAIVEYQVYQTENGADISIISNSKINIKTIEDKLKVDLEKQGLVKPQIKLIQKEKLDRHQETGKIRRFIPLKE